MDCLETAAEEIQDNEGEMPVILPPELHIEIMKWLGEPLHHPSSFERSQINVKTLSSLCLVSHALNYVTTPTLYKLIYLTPKNLQAFATSVCMSSKRCSEVVALAITEFPETFPEDEIGYSLIEGLIIIFRALAPSLKRLLLDAPFRSADWTVMGEFLSETLLGLGSIEEAIITQDEPRPPGYYDGTSVFQYWPTTKRLAVYNVPVDIRALPSIERLCILNLNSGWAENGTLDVFLQSVPPFSQLLLLDYENHSSELGGEIEATIDQYSPLTSDGMARELARKHPNILKMVNVKESDGTSMELSMTAWFRSVAISGVLWDLERFALNEEDLAVDLKMLAGAYGDVSRRHVDDAAQQPNE